jgi:predicted transcriptional regulator
MKTGRKKRMISPRKRRRSTLPPDRSRSRSRSAASSASVSSPSESAGLHWTLLTNHAHVLVLLSRNPPLVLREVALKVGITERAVQRIIADLEAGGMIEREKIGRQNRYRIRMGKHLRHPVESHSTVGELLALLNGAER